MNVENYHEQNVEKAMAAIAADKEIQVTLHEKGDSWVVLAKPTECWYEWAIGKVWWEPGEGCGSCPEWAADLRGEWDHAWS